MADKLTAKNAANIVTQVQPIVCETVLNEILRQVAIEANAGNSYLKYLCMKTPDNRGLRRTLEIELEKLGYKVNKFEDCLDIYW